MQFEQKGDTFGQPLVTPVDSSNHWWGLFEDAVAKVDGKLGTPEIFPSATDARFVRAAGLPAFGFSPISDTPILLHEHNEVGLLCQPFARLFSRLNCVRGGFRTQKEVIFNAIMNACNKKCFDSIVMVYGRMYERIGTGEILFACLQNV